MIPFGEYLPDQPDLMNPGATEAKNAVPRTLRSYGPFADLNVATNALTDRCQGAFAARDAAGNVVHFAGDETNLYKLSTATWSDVSGATYSTPGDGFWSFAFSGIGGTPRVIATNHSNNIQTWTLGTSSAFADLAAAAPRARYVAAIYPGFLMVGNTFDSTDGNVPNRVWWPAIFDPTDWPTVGSADAASKQSDFNDMLEGGWVNQITGAVGGAAGAVFTDTVLYRIDYAGPPTVFDFIPIERSRGTPAPNSVINIGPKVFYLGEDGFYEFDGSQSTPIGDQKVDSTFFEDLDQSYFDRIRTTQKATDKLVYWAYPGAGNTNGNPNKMLIYHGS